MKEMNNFFRVFFTVLAIICLVFVIGCKDPEEETPTPTPDPGTDPDPGRPVVIDVTLQSVTANGAAGGANTSQLTLTFSAAVEGLTVNDVVLGGSPAVNKVSMTPASAANTTYYLAIGGFTSSGTLTVTASKTGYNITGSPTVNIYYTPPDNRPVVNLTDIYTDGANGKRTTWIEFFFNDNSLTGLNADNIVFTPADGVVKGNVMNSGSGRFSLQIVNVAKTAQLTFTITKDGYNISNATNRPFIVYDGINPFDASTISIYSVGVDQDGVPGTQYLHIVFTENIRGLTADDIYLTSGIDVLGSLVWGSLINAGFDNNGKVISMEGSGHYLLPISGFTVGGKISVTASKVGYNITYNTATNYTYITKGITLTSLEQQGGRPTQTNQVGLSTTHLTFSLSDPVELKLADIQLKSFDNNSPATADTLSPYTNGKFYQLSLKDVDSGSNSMMTLAIDIKDKNIDNHPLYTFGYSEPNADGIAQVRIYSAKQPTMEVVLISAEDKVYAQAVLDQAKSPPPASAWPKQTDKITFTFDTRNDNSFNLEAFASDFRVSDIVLRGVPGLSIKDLTRVDDDSNYVSFTLGIGFNTLINDSREHDLTVVLSKYNFDLILGDGEPAETIVKIFQARRPQDGYDYNPPVFPPTAPGAGDTEYLYYYLATNGREFSVSENSLSNNDTDTFVTVPPYFEGLPVTAIYQNGFPGDKTDFAYTTIDLSGNVVIKEAVRKKDGTIVEPKEVTGIVTIGQSAFSGNKTLTGITFADKGLDNKLTTIGNQAFYRCEKLVSTGTLWDHDDDPDTPMVPTYFVLGTDGKPTTTVAPFTIPFGVTSIGTGAFADCEELVKVIIPQGVTNIRQDTFSGCTALEEVIIPNGVTEIGVHAFAYTGLKTITIPATVTRIGAGAFREINNIPGNPTLQTVIYGGSRAQWDALIASGAIDPTYNEALIREATVNTLRP